MQMPRSSHVLFQHPALPNGPTTPLSTGRIAPHFFYPASPPSDRVIPTLSLVHWHTQHPSHLPLPPLQMTEHLPSFVDATSHWTSHGCHSCPLTPSKSSTSSPWCSTLCIAPPFTAYYYRTVSPAPSGVHNDGADDASGRHIRYLSRPSFVRARKSRGEALPAAVPNPPALAAGHP
jgi:hypothetical protein